MCVFLASCNEDVPLGERITPKNHISYYFEFERGLTRGENSDLRGYLDDLPGEMAKNGNPSLESEEGLIGEARVRCLRVSSADSVESFHLKTLDLLKPFHNKVPFSLTTTGFGQRYVN